MLAVTTRNKLHSTRFSLPMLQARRHVRDQLATTPGLIRYASAIASPTEFLTLTVWESRQAMFNFMSSGAHEQFMWMFSRWSASFWSMRWVPTTMEEGAWEGLSLASRAEPGDQTWRAALPKAPQLPLPERRPGRHVGDPSASGVYAIFALVDVANPGDFWVLLRAVRSFRCETDHVRPLRWSVGSVEPCRFLALTLWHDDALEGPADAVRRLRRSLNASWTMCWRAGEYEIGHWNGLRLRQLPSARTHQQRMKLGAVEQVGSDMQ